MKKTPVYHPFLFALIPILYAYAHNLKKFPLSLAEIILPLILSLITAYLLFGIVALLLKDQAKAGLIATVFIFVFYSFGPAYNSVRYLLFGSLHYILLIIMTLLLILLVFRLLKYTRQIKYLTRLLNSIALILLAMNSSLVIWNSIKNTKFRIRNRSFVSMEAKSSPDIYYLILDGYGRADILKDIFNYDNSEFIGFLQKRGFFVATESRANYSQTILSLSSSLNLSYLDQLIQNLSPTSVNRQPVIELIRSSLVQDFLKSRGYITIAFSSGYLGTELRNADIYLNPVNSLSEFQTLLLSMTPLSVLITRSESLSFLARHSRRILGTFNGLASLKKPNRPCFIFAHILAPHPPFVFEENGGKNPMAKDLLYSDGDHLHRSNRKGIEEYIDNYKKQITFITQKTEETIDAILISSKEKPVIIIQADHGPGAFLHWESVEATDHKERLSILNAYYFPKKGYADLYEQITPVNSFRIVFNLFFNTDYPLLNDRSYYSRWRLPFRFHDVGPLMLLDLPPATQASRK